MCDDVCIPEEGKFALDLPVGAAAKPADANTRALFDKARRVVPTDSPWPARFGLAKSGDPTLVVEAKGLKPDTIRSVYFFPAEWGPVASMAKQTASVTAEGIRIPLKKGDAKAAAPQSIAGTLVLTEKTGDGEQRQAFDLVAKLDPAFVPSAAPLTASNERREPVAGRGAAVRAAGRPDPEPDALRVPGAGDEGGGLRAARRP